MQLRKNAYIYWFTITLGYYNSLKIETKRSYNDRWTVRNTLSVNRSLDFFPLQFRYEEDESRDRYIKISTDGILFLHEIRVFDTLRVNVRNGEYNS